MEVWKPIFTFQASNHSQGGLSHRRLKEQLPGYLHRMICDWIHIPQFCTDVSVLVVGSQASHSLLWACVYICKQTSSLLSFRQHGRVTVEFWFAAQNSQYSVKLAVIELIRDSSEGQFVSFKYSTKVSEKTCFHMTWSMLKISEQSLSSSMDPNKPVWRETLPESHSTIIRSNSSYPGMWWTLVLCTETHISIHTEPEQQTTQQGGMVLNILCHRSTEKILCELAV